MTGAITGGRSVANSSVFNSLDCEFVCLFTVEDLTEEGGDVGVAEEVVEGGGADVRVVVGVEDGY